MRFRLRPLLLSVAACFAAAAAGNIVTAPTLRTEWYQSLNKPPWQPPPMVFGPVWTILYAMIAFSGAFLWSAGRTAESHPAKAFFIAQLLLNASWTPVFFGLRSLGGGLAIIVALWLAILGYLVTARRVSRVAAWLFLPYFLWVSFAATINAWIWAKNPGD